jgi:hypothetical protein
MRLPRLASGSFIRSAKDDSSAMPADSPPWQAGGLLNLIVMQLKDFTPIGLRPAGLVPQRD